MAKFKRDDPRKVVVYDQVPPKIVLGGTFDSQKGTFSNVVKGGLNKFKKTDVSLVLEGKDISNDLSLKPSMT